MRTKEGPNAEHWQSAIAHRLLTWLACTSVAAIGCNGPGQNVYSPAPTHLFMEEGLREQPPLEANRPQHNAESLASGTIASGDRTKEGLVQAAATVAGLEQVALQPAPLAANPSSELPPLLPPATSRQPSETT